MKNYVLIIVSTTFYSVSFAQLQMGDRTIGFSTTNSQSDITYDTAFAYALNACAKTNYQIFKWGEVEISNGNFDQAKLNDMDSLDIALPLFGLQLDLTLTTYDIVNKTLPADISSLPFNSPIIISRFQSFIDTIMNHFSNITFHSLNIGNESDAAMGNNATFITEYKIFYETIVSYIHSKYPDIKVGTVITFNGLTNTATKALYKSLNDSSDVITCNYYNVNDTFYAKPPSNVITDMSTLVAEYPASTIYFTEFGYPSSTSLNSSTTMQSQFITDMFTAWDNHAANIKHISYFSITEWKHSTAVQLAQSIGLDSTSNYVPFLETLGLRTWQGWGINKPAYNTFVSEALIRGACYATESDEFSPHQKLAIFPNPASTNFMIVMPFIDVQSTIRIYDITGHLLSSYICSGVRNFQISTEFWPNGVYFIELASRTQIQTEQITIIK